MLFNILGSTILTLGDTYVIDKTCYTVNSGSAPPVLGFPVKTVGSLYSNCFDCIADSNPCPPSFLSQENSFTIQQEDGSNIIVT